MDRELARVGQQKLIIASFSSHQSGSDYSNVEANGRTLCLACETVTSFYCGASDNVLVGDSEDNFLAIISDIQISSLDMQL